jgi:hypothetical protein
MDDLMSLVSVPSNSHEHELVDLLGRAARQANVAPRAAAPADAGTGLLGRVLDSHGRPLDALPPIESSPGPVAAGGAQLETGIKGSTCWRRCRVVGAFC